MLGRLLRLPLRLLPPSFIMPILQGPCRGCRWTVGSTNHGAWLGSYERETQLKMAQVVRPGWVAYDIGAHVGVYTLLLSHLVKPEGHVVSFEPVPKNLSFLHGHIEMNKLLNVTIVEAALSDHEGLDHFKLEESSAMGHLDKDGELKIQTLTMDSYVQRSGRLPDLIKIDVEGAEAAVLRGAQQLLRERPPVIFLSTHGMEAHKTCCAILSQGGYTLQPLSAVGLEQAREIIALPCRMLGRQNP